MNRVLLVLFWSVIAAAFIGPGTLTTCGAAGSRFGFDLLWALVFSGFACFVLQEGSARITAASGLTLAEAIRRRSGGALGRVLASGLVAGAIVIGCAAYEAGNLLGAVGGAALHSDLPEATLISTIAFGAAALLALGTAHTVARIMGALVAVMAAAFVATAGMLAPDAGAVLVGSLVPSLPFGSGLVVIGLIGTTVVPYNLFLGSGLARGQSIREIRFGLAVAVGLGAVVSMAVVVVGTSVGGGFSFGALADALSARLGPWAAVLFAAGLFAAGFSSAVTAPLAAAMTCRGLFGDRDDDRWSERAWRYRTVWGAVVLTGLVVGLLDVRPIPVILAAQALNGILLPFVAGFLIVVVNDRAIMGDRGVSGALGNVAIGLSALVTLVLGARNVLGVAARAISAPPPNETGLLLASAILAVTFAAPVAVAARRARRSR